MPKLSANQVKTLAPDSASLKAGQKLAEFLNAYTVGWDCHILWVAHSLPRTPVVQYEV